MFGFPFSMGPNQFSEPTWDLPFTGTHTDILNPEGFSWFTSLHSEWKLAQMQHVSLKLIKTSIKNKLTYFADIFEGTILRNNLVFNVKWLPPSTKPIEAKGWGIWKRIYFLALFCLRMLVTLEVSYKKRRHSLNFSIGKMTGNFNSMVLSASPSQVFALGLFFARLRKMKSISKIPIFSLLLNQGLFVSSSWHEISVQFGLGC